MAVVNLEQNRRAQALISRIARLEPRASRLDAVALGLVDAVLEADGETLAAALDALRDVRARTPEDAPLCGWLDAAISVTYWGFERLPPTTGPARGTQGRAFLAALDGPPHLGSPELRQLLEIDETQVSRAGRRLLDQGLVTRRKVGRQVLWQLSPRGRRVVEQPEAEAAPDERPGHNADFWLNALRRGFDATAGDRHGGLGREADPTRDRIIAITLQLHQAQGIQATKFKDIAVRAGLSVGAVKAVFPTQDALVRACGEHVVETLRLPPPDRVPEVFTGATSRPERVRRLVSTSFGVYERGADALTVGRRERGQVAAVAESMDHVDRSFNALVAEALRPRRPDTASIASVRALTDLEVWRTLRAQGASPDRAVDQATAAVEGWLRGRPSLSVPATAW